MTTTDAQDDRPVGGTGDLAAFLGGSPDSFKGKLLDLIDGAQAAPEHWARLELAFPAEVNAWRTWQSMSPAPTFGQLRARLDGQASGDGQQYPKWQPLAERTRQALRLLGYDVPDCLPGERGACGADFAQHAAAFLGALQAVVEHRLIHLGAGMRPLVDEICATTREQLQAAEACEEHPAVPGHGDEHQAPGFFTP